MCEPRCAMDGSISFATRRRFAEGSAFGHESLSLASGDSRY